MAAATAREGIGAVVIAIVGALSGVASAWVTAGKAVPGKIEQALTEQGTRLSSVDAKLTALETRAVATVPIGSIVASLVPPERLDEASGDDSRLDPRTATWIPADGRKVPGSKYVKVFGRSQVPDLRGLFLRGLNYSEEGEVRSDGYREPDADSRKAGELEMDTFQGHGHKHEQGVGPDNPEGTFKGVNGNNIYGPNRIFDPTELGKYGTPRLGSETRPKNAAVYYYIRVN